MLLSINFIIKLNISGEVNNFIKIHFYILNQDF